MVEKEITTNEVKKMLDEKGIKPSFQRMSILKYLMVKMNHPSVDDIYRSLMDKIPTLSRTTIYNTLNLLIENDIITALTINENEIRYDLREKPHAHFQCNLCGKIYDVNLDSEIFNIKNIAGHRVLETQINFKGICKKCLEKNQ